MVESFFFMSLGISFFLIFLMVYHFKNRVDTLEKNNEALADICQTMVAELEVLRQNIHKPSFENHNILSSLFQMPTEEKVPFIIKEGPAPTFDFEEEDEMIDNIVVEEIEEMEEIEEIEEKVETKEEKVEEKDVKYTDQMNELQSIFDDTVSELEQDFETKTKKKAYKKMNLAMLRTVAVNKGFSGSEQELWKLKKNDILSWIEKREGEESKGEEKREEEKREEEKEGE